MRVFLSVNLFIVCLAHGHAGELLNSHVNYEDDHYFLHLDMRVKGESQSIYNLLVDFEHIPAINDTIVFSKLLASKNRKHRVHIESEGCIWVFCRRIKQVVTVTEMGQGYIVSETDPAESDMKYGRTLWQVIDEGKTTRIKYHADFVPDFWIPPFFGPILFKDRMLEEGLKTINGIEFLANEY